MKNYLLNFCILLSSTAFSQSYYFKFGVEHLEGKLPGISTYYSADSYRLTNYPTLSFLIVDEDQITEGDLSMFSFALMGLAVKDENGKAFAGYNTTTKSNTNFFSVQNRKLFEWSNTKFKSEHFHMGKQIGLDYFGAGIGVKKFGLSNNGISEPNPGPYVSRMNLFAGFNFYYAKNFSDAFELKLGTTLDASLSLVTVGLHTSPKMRFVYNLNFIRFSADVNYDIDYYYARTQSAYKGVEANIPSKTVMPTNFRFNLGIAFRFRDK